MVKYIILLASAILITITLKAQTTLIPFGASWAYADQGELPDTTWKEPSFADENWKSGPALLGYGLKALATQVSFGPDTANKYITTYFRKAFTIADADLFRTYWAKVRRDDGVVVYVNGREVYRNNLPNQPITHHTRAASATDDGTIAQDFSIGPWHFVDGRNVIAVEVHQTSPQSSDMAFDLELTGSTTNNDQLPPTVLSILRKLPAEKVTSATALTFRVTFSEAVTGVNAADFFVKAEEGEVAGVLAADGVAAVGSNKTTYDVTVSSVTGTGELRLDLKAGNTGIADIAGNAISGGFTAGQSYTVTRPGNEDLISFNAVWKYLDNGKAQDTTWKEPSFTDDNWKSGPALLGYGVKALATQVSFGPDTANKYITTYFRKAFTIADADLFRTYWAKVRRDDGVVVYVNGREVYRNNLPNQLITHHTRATSATDDGTIDQHFSIGPWHFVDGRNVIAVEVHQTSPQSSDMAFDLELTGSTTNNDQLPPTVLSILRKLPAEKVTSATALTFRVTFSEAVTGVNAADFFVKAEEGEVAGVLAADGVAAVGSNKTTYDVTVSSVTGKGELRLDLKAGNTGIADAAGNTFSGGYTAGQSYTVLPPSTHPALTRGPYLQMGSQTAVSLRWRTKTAVDSKVEVGTVYGSYPLEFSDASPTTEHQIRITGLKAGTRYYYRLGSSTQVLQSGPDNFFATAPAPNDKAKVRIAVLGDCGKQKSKLQADVLQAYRRHVGPDPADLLLLLGDNAYPDGTDEDYQLGFFNAYDSTILKNHMLFPAPGNHDYHTTSLAVRTAPYYKIFTTPTKGESGGVPSGAKGYYSFDWGNIHFISLDSDGTEGPANWRLSDTLAAQAKWVKKDLEANKLPWVVVYWHHPPYSMGSHNSDTEDQLAEIRENFLRILERYGVDLVLTGHSHNYERSYFINGHFGKEASFSPSKHKASTSSGKYNDSEDSCPYLASGQGTVYLVSGSAAQVGRTQESWPHRAMPFSDNEGGMVYLEIEQNRLDAKYLRSDGKVWDQFTMMKDVNKTTEVSTTGEAPTRLTASWVGTYNWSTGETSRTISVNPNSNTTYRVTDDSKCLTDVFRVNVTGSTALKLQVEDQTGVRLAHREMIVPTLVSKGTRVLVQTPAREQIQAQVVDINGRLISRTSFTNATYIETGSLPAGMYIILLQGQNYLKTQKFMVMD